MTHSRHNEIIAKTACLMLVVLAFLPLRAQSTMQLGYCKDRPVTFMALTGEAAGGSAVFFPATAMQAYSGCQITEICVGVNVASDDSRLRVFIARQLDATPLYEQTVTGVRRNWNSIELAEPFTIDGDSLYIGYEVTGQYNLSYCNALYDGQEWINSGNGEWTQYTGVYSAAVYATVAGSQLPRNNVKLGNIIMPGYAVAGRHVGFEGEFLNLGCDTVRSLTFTYMADGQTIGDETVDIAPTASRSTGTFRLEALTFDTSGTRTIQLQCTAINGQPDADPSDNASRRKEIVCLDDFVERNVLLEFFSTELCPSCPGVHSVVDPVIDGLANVVEIGHHAGYYTDQYTVDASKDYEWFYGDSLLYAPAMMFDRSCFAENLPSAYDASCPVIGVSVWQLYSAMAEATAVPAMAELSLDCRLDTASRQLSLSVRGRQLIELARADQVRLSCVLTEDSIYTTSQAGATYGYYHRHTLRRTLTPVWGEPVDIAGGFERSFEVDLPAEWDMAKLSAVAYVAYYDSTDYNACQVLNCVEAHVGSQTSASTAIDDMAAGDATVSFDGQNIIAPDGHCGLTVYDMAGNVRLRQSPGRAVTPLGSLPRGLYVVRVGTSGGMKTLKIAL